ESIADFVADIRASTPSQAAYYLLHHNQEFLAALNQRTLNFSQSIYDKVRERLHLLQSMELRIDRKFDAKTTLIRNKLARLEFMVALAPKELERIKENLYSKLRIISSFSPLQKIKEKVSLLQKYLGD